ncbi:MAG: hypothetical protein A2452_04480 [Candidatus Firestonebacteria bacterium RIFOXYC2_FULL_39_67]|nr:MAG: hypothetical protein A2536_10595 [Candidatus Firestonebacteria bacterium RIFOXYD2_FULL_39_29]OGF57638.1 MAG: hypothetical protein A2452_04480 [Candidatus Firestonebacteria bacterium RIFOXYC2_FULL_39_67]
MKKLLVLCIVFCNVVVAADAGVSSPTVVLDVGTGSKAVTSVNNIAVVAGLEIENTEAASEFGIGGGAEYFSGSYGYIVGMSKRINDNISLGIDFGRISTSLVEDRSFVWYNNLSDYNNKSNGNTVANLTQIDTISFGFDLFADFYYSDTLFIRSGGGLYFQTIDTIVNNTDQGSFVKKNIAMQFGAGADLTKFLSVLVGYHSILGINVQAYIKF